MICSYKSSRGPSLEFPMALKTFRCSSSARATSYLWKGTVLCFLSGGLTTANNKQGTRDFFDKLHRKDIKHPWEVTVTSAICSQGDSTLPIVLSAVVYVREDAGTLGSFWHLSSSARKFSQLPHWALTAFIIYTGPVSDVDLRKWVKYWERTPEKQSPRTSRERLGWKAAAPAAWPRPFSAGSFCRRHFIRHT